VAGGRCSGEVAASWSEEAEGWHGEGVRGVGREGSEGEL